MAHCCQSAGSLLLQNIGIAFGLPRLPVFSPRRANGKIAASAPRSELSESVGLIVPQGVVCKLQPLFAFRGCDVPSPVTCEDILSNGIAAFRQLHRKPLQRDSSWLSVGLLNIKLSKSGHLLFQRRGFRTRSSSGIHGVDSISRASVSSTAPSTSSIFTFLNKMLNPADQDSLKKLLEHRSKGTHSSESTRVLSEGSSAEETQRIKLAFADGYLKGTTADTAKASGRKQGYGKSVMKFLIYANLFILFLYFATGSFRDFPVKVMFSSGNEIFPEDVSVTFADVKGIDEAKEEVMEIVEYLRDPDKFSRLGGRLPRGVLLVGPPGTGKTLLARAIAGEAGVPFFHASGSEFDELLVGQGAKRVRELFDTAKDRSPCVVFIDEIDSVGQKRTNSSLHPYANQTVNQLLAEMDGFKQIDGVIVLGASNRKDDLDKALLRPGRFDIQVFVNIPDLRGRKEILNLYLGKIVLNEDIEVETLARGTTGFSGADLENMVNKAALRAAADGKKDVNMYYLESSRDKILMGPEKKNRIPDENVNKNTAYHEAGHTLVAFYNKESIPLHKVTIVPRGNSLGHTAMIPDKEMYSQSKAELLASLDVLMGGRVAEELIFGVDQVTTGASNDLDKATEIAHNMVKVYGMSEKVGLRTFTEDRGAVIQMNDLSPNTTDAIDSEIKRILNDSYERAKHVLKTHAVEHKRLAEVLLEYETLDAKEIAAVINGTSPMLTRLAR